MRSSWRDPDDITPNARRTARAIAGFWAGCALRRMMHHHAGRSSIIEEHVIAADLLRLQVDAVLIGFFPRPPRANAGLCDHVWAAHGAIDSRAAIR